MRFLSLLTTMVALFLGVAVASTTNGDICRNFPKGGEIMAAIAKLCDNHPGGDTMMTPGPYGLRGANVGGVHVSVKANCSPRKWLPNSWCHIHFRTACSQGNGGFGGEYFGCQGFFIEQVKDT